MAMALPLHLRLPNPPPLFLARNEICSRLIEALARSPVAALFGAEGVGKTATASHLVSGHFADRLAGTCYLRFRADRDPAELSLEAARHHLVAAREPPDSLAGQTPAQILRIVLDAIEREPDQAPWFVLDDVHHIQPAPREHLADLLARYARSSRWLLVGSAPLVGVPFEQQVELPPIDADGLRALARALVGADREAEAEAAVAGAGGSPRRLRALLGLGSGPLRGQAARGTGDHALLQTLPACAVDEDARAAAVMRERAAPGRERRARGGADRRLAVTADGRAIRRGDEQIDLSRRGGLRRVLERLLAEARVHPNEPLGLAGLFAAGWPGQSIASDMAARRVYWAIASLRRLGLGSAIKTGENGYYLDPASFVIEDKGGRS